MALARPVVEFSAAGAERLGRSVLARGSPPDRLARAPARARRLARTAAARRAGAAALRPADARGQRDPSLLQLPDPGGLLARRAAGELSFEQTADALRSTIRGFFPRVANYDRLQGRLHVAVSRRYFRRLIAEAAR